MTVYCYDTEFLEDGYTIDLISIGIVCEDGREYYAVNSEMDEKRISKSDWLMKNVVQHLPLHHYEPPRDGLRWIWSLDMHDTRVKPKWVIANEVREFLLQGVTDCGGDVILDGPELWAYYGAYDHIALMQLWGPMIRKPNRIPMWTHDLMQLIEPLRGFEKPPQDGTAHDALEDARWNMKLLKAARAAL